MQNKQTKLLFESWRAFLKEEEKPQEQGANKAFQTLDQLVDKAYPEFVQGLQDLIKNQEFASLLKTSNPADSNNKLNVQETTVKCVDLQPMQNIIGLDDSLLFDLAGKVSAETTAKKCSGTALPPEVYDHIARPIITCGNYIIDGHHRWSTCYMLNPNNSLKVQNITNFKDGTSALKASQLIIGAIKGEIPTSKPKGINVYSENLNSISQWILKTMVDQFVKVYLPTAQKIVKDGEPLKESLEAIINEAQEQNEEKKICTKALIKNIMKLRTNNAPKGDASKNPRTIMPQFSDDGPAKELKNAIAGQGVNVKAIKQAIGVQESLQNKIKLIIKEEIKKIKNETNS